MGGLVSEGHGGRSQVVWSVVGHLHLEQDVSLGEEDDQHLVVARQVPVVLQDVSWTTRENCLKDSVIVSSIAIEELVFWKVSFLTSMAVPSCLARLEKVLEL